MNAHDKKSTQTNKEDYGNVILSMLMGTAAVVGIWYFSSILLTIVKTTVV